MGMYNEVSKACPDCGQAAIMQVRQYVLGFGNFNLDDLSTLNDLTETQLHELRAEVQEDWWHCQTCHKSFNPYRDEARLGHQALARALFG